MWERISDYFDPPHLVVLQMFNQAIISPSAARCRPSSDLMTSKFVLPDVFLFLCVIFVLATPPSFESDCDGIKMTFDIHLIKLKTSRRLGFGTMCHQSAPHSERNNQQQSFHSPLRLKFFIVKLVLVYTKFCLNKLQQFIDDTIWAICIWCAQQGNLLN